MAPTPLRLLKVGSLKVGSPPPCRVFDTEFHTTCDRNLLAIIFQKFAGKMQDTTRNSSVSGAARYTLDLKRAEDRSLSSSEFALIVRSFLAGQGSHGSGAGAGAGLEAKVLTWLFYHSKRVAPPASLTASGLDVVANAHKVSHDITVGGLARRPATANAPPSTALLSSSTVPGRLPTPRKTNRLTRHMRPATAGRGAQEALATDALFSDLSHVPRAGLFHLGLEQEQTAPTDHRRMDFDEFACALVRLALYVFGGAGEDAGSVHANNNAVVALAAEMGLSGPAGNLKKRCDDVIRRHVGGPYVLLKKGDAPRGGVSFKDAGSATPPAPAAAAAAPSSVIPSATTAPASSTPRVSQPAAAYRPTHTLLSRPEASAARFTPLPVSEVLLLFPRVRVCFTAMWSFLSSHFPSAWLVLLAG